MRKRGALMIAAAAFAVAIGAQAADAPNLGRVATPEDIARGDLIVAPDGANLPPGSGSVSQGLAVYTEKCAACHGEAGQGGPQDRLTGAIGTIATAEPVKTVASYWPYATTVFDYIRRAMPANAPQSLRDEEVYAVTAYLLSIDGIVSEDTVLDAQTLPHIEMPNREGFVPWSPDLAR